MSKNQQQKINGLALKKLREIKKLTRKEASILLEVSHKTIEGYENGRLGLSPIKINQILKNYGFKKEDLALCIAGKAQVVIKKYSIDEPRSKVIENNNLRRSYKKLITKDCETLRVLRLIKGLTQDEASSICGYSRPTIGHIENGRIELSIERIKLIVKTYGFKMKDFEHHRASESFVTDIQDECIQFIKKLSEEKLKTVQSLLLTLTKGV